MQRSPTHCSIVVLCVAFGVAPQAACEGSGRRPDVGSLEESGAPDALPLDATPADATELDAVVAMDIVAPRDSAPEGAPSDDVAPADGAPDAPAACPTPGLRRCGDRCVDLASDNTNCGACGASCTASPHASSACNAGECELTCEAGFANCDADAVNGCEASLSSAMHCGACGRACSGADLCIGGACRAAEMTPAPRPFAPSVAGRTPSRRPTFGLVLASGVAGAEVQVCRDRGCTDVASTFAFDGSRGRAPESLERGLYWWRSRSRVAGRAVGAYSPTWFFRVTGRETSASLAWGTMPDVNADGLADVVVGTAEDSMTRGEVRAFYGTRATMPTAVSWSRRGFDGMGDIGGSDVGGFFGNSLASSDVNGDGLVDLVVGASFVASGTGRAYVFAGSTDGPRTSPLWTIGAAAPVARFAWVLSSGADVNADGFGDFIAGAPNTGNITFYGSALVYYGQATGQPATASVVLRHADDVSGRRAGYGVAMLGDINADGFGDVAMSASHRNDEPGRVAVYAGTSTGLATVPLQVLRTPGGGENFDLFGEAMAGVGDVNGDGFDDLLASSPKVNGEAGAAWLFAGSASGLLAAPIFETRGMEPMARIGSFVAGGGDIDGDGYDDFVVLSDRAGTARVYFGAPSGVRGASVALTNTEGDPLLAATRAAVVGDTNGDGYDDVVLGAPTDLEGAGTVYLFRGRADGVSSTPAWTVQGDATARGLGWSIAR